MIIKIIRYLILFCLFLTNVYAVDEVRNYANQLIKDELKILNDPISSDLDKVKRTRDLIISNLDLDWMVRYTLGGYRNILKTEEIHNLKLVYSRYISKVYADLVKDYNGPGPEVLSVESIGSSEYVVSMKIGAMNVKYLVHYRSGNYLVADIIIEGVSLIAAQQVEFINILTAQGYESLIAELLKKSN